MYGFLIKKNLFDGWDNMLYIIVPNLVMIACISIFTFFSHYVFEYNFILSVVLLVIGIVTLTICIFAYGDTALDISNFKGVTVKQYFLSFKKAIKDGFLFSLILGILFVLGYVVIPFYVNWSNTVGLLLAALMLWIIILSVLALQWFFPLRNLQKAPFFRTLKNCYGYFFDNPLFSIFLLLYNLVLTILSIPVFLVIPSFSGIALAQMNAVRLRLYKYDYIAEHPELTKKQRKKLPWKEILKEDMDCIGPRTIKSFIFPGRE